MHRAIQDGLYSTHLFLNPCFEDRYKQFRQPVIATGLLVLSSIAASNSLNSAISAAKICTPPLEDRRITRYSRTLGASHSLRYPHPLGH